MLRFSHKKGFECVSRRIFFGISMICAKNVFEYLARIFLGGGEVALEEIRDSFDTKHMPSFDCRGFDLSIENFVLDYGIWFGNNLRLGLLKENLRLGL